MYLYLLLFISFILPADIFKGRVVDTLNKPVYNANVQILDTDFGSSTDKDGYFIIDNINANHFTIKVSHIAFEEQVIYIGEISNNLVITMNPKSIQLDRVVVTGTKSNRHIKNTPVLTHVIGQEDIKNSSYIAPIDHRCLFSQKIIILFIQIDRMKGEVRKK